MGGDKISQRAYATDADDEADKSCSVLALRTVCGWLKREDWIEKPGRLTKMVLPYMAKLSFPRAQ